MFLTFHRLFTLTVTLRAHEQSKKNRVMMHIEHITANIEFEYSFKLVK